MKIVCQLEQWYTLDHPVFAVDQVEFRQDPAGADLLIADTKPLTPADLDRAPNLRGIVRVGAGFDNVPLDYCRARRLVCAYTPNAPSWSVAEFTVGLILACARRMWFPTAEERWGRHMGRELCNQKLGIVGLGRIGKRVAHLMQPMVAEIVGCDPLADTTFDDCHDVQRMDLDDLLGYADIVTLHIPRTGNEGLFTRDRLAKMKPDSILVNTSRGGIVDESALFDILRENPDRLAAVDVFEDEPYHGPLWCMPNCQVTCHMASMTTEARRRMETQALEAAAAILFGREPQWRIPGSF